jgi:membrane-bound lytic murein transglycosylase B
MPTKSWLYAAAACLLLILPRLEAAATPVEDPFSALAQRLAADGFSAQRLQTLFSAPQVAFDTEGVSLFFVHSEGRLDYEQFARPEPIARARNYMTRHGAALDKASRAYGVDREVITGILLVETQLGRYTGKRSVFNTLSTMATLSDPDLRRYFWDQIPPGRRIGADQFAAKADSKSAWAYAELKAFLQFTGREGIDPLSVAGSYAGAMGICQFMPSNALRLAVDANQDGRVDLFDHEDAIASVARYLKHHGWRPELPRQRRYQVILRYNYSRPYANIILKIAELLAPSRS